MTNRFLKQGGDFSGFGHVGGDGYSAGAQGFDLSDDGGGRCRGTGVVDDHGGATESELEGVLTAHAAARTGDEGDFAVEAGGGGAGWGGHSDGVWGWVMDVTVRLERGVLRYED